MSDQRDRVAKALVEAYRKTTGNETLGMWFQFELADAAIAAMNEPEEPELSPLDALADVCRQVFNEKASTVDPGDWQDSVPWVHEVWRDVVRACLRHIADGAEQRREFDAATEDVIALVLGVPRTEYAEDAE